MYYEEKMINGVMHYRNHPDDEFTPYTLVELSKRYEAAKEDAKRIRERGASGDEGTNFNALLLSEDYENASMPKM